MKPYKAVHAGELLDMLDLVRGIRINMESLGVRQCKELDEIQSEILGYLKRCLEPKLGVSTFVYWKKYYWTWAVSGNWSENGLRKLESFPIADTIPTINAPKEKKSDD